MFVAYLSVRYQLLRVGWKVLQKYTYQMVKAFITLQNETRDNYSLTKAKNSVVRSRSIPRHTTSRIDFVKVSQTNNQLNRINTSDKTSIKALTTAVQQFQMNRPISLHSKMPYQLPRNSVPYLIVFPCRRPFKIEDFISSSRRATSLRDRITNRFKVNAAQMLKPRKITSKASSHQIFNEMIEQRQDPRIVASDNPISNALIVTVRSTAAMSPLILFSISQSICCFNLANREAATFCILTINTRQMEMGSSTWQVSPIYCSNWQSSAMICLVTKLLQYLQPTRHKQRSSNPSQYLIATLCFTVVQMACKQTSPFYLFSINCPPTILRSSSMIVLFSR